METIQPGKHQRTLASRLDVNTFSATKAIIRVVIMIACQLALSYSFPIILRQGPARWFIRMLSAYFLVDGDVDQLLKHVMTFLAVLYTCITARTLSEIPIAEAQTYHGDCVIVAVRAALDICPSQASQFESTLVRTQRIIKYVRRDLLSSGA